MKAPSRNEMQLGSRAGLALSGVTAVVAVVAWMDGSVPWLVPVGGLLLVNAARKAKVRVEAYQRWRGEWDQMAGGQGAGVLPPAEERAALRSKDETGARAVGADATARKPRTGVALVATWAVLLVGLVTQPGSTNGYAAAALLWVLLTALGAIRMLVWLGGRVLRPASAREFRTERDDIVRVCLPVPRDVPSLRALHAALPDYCKPLLRPPQ